MGLPLTMDQLKGITPGEGESFAGSPGGEDFLGKVNSIINGINAIFENYQRLRGNITAQSGADQAQGKPPGGPMVAPADPKSVGIIVDQRLLQLVAKTFSNKALNIPLKQLIGEFGDLTMVEAMEKLAKEADQDSG